MHYFHNTTGSLDALLSYKEWFGLREQIIYLSKTTVKLNQISWVTKDCDLARKVKIRAYKNLFSVNSTLNPSTSKKPPYTRHQQKCRTRSNSPLSPIEVVLQFLLNCPNFFIMGGSLPKVWRPLVYSPSQRQAPRRCHQLSTNCTSFSNQ